MRTGQQGEPQHAAAALTIGQLATRTGIGAKTIRYYESIGLLPQPPRGENRYRRYGAADLNRLLLLRCIRLLGVSLALAKPLLAGASDASCAAIQQDLQCLVEQRLRDIDQELAELRRLRSYVSQYQLALGACQAEAEMPFGACPDMRCIAEQSKVSTQEVCDGP